jgi:hypothetical protein
MLEISGMLGQLIAPWGSFFFVMDRWSGEIITVITKWVSQELKDSGATSARFLPSYQMCRAT